MSKNLYCKPFPIGIGIRRRSAPYHKTSRSMTFAIDFAMPIGTPIFAAADGIVVERVSNLRKNYLKPHYKARPNYLRIKHKYGEFSEYLHLASGLCFVSVGEYVKSGQIIALCGMTGYCTYSHLHFAVLNGRFYSIPITFTKNKHER